MMMRRDPTVRGELEVMTHGILARKEVRNHRSDPRDDSCGVLNILDRPQRQFALVAPNGLSLRSATHEEIEPFFRRAEGVPAHDTSRSEVSRLVTGSSRTSRAQAVSGVSPASNLPSTPFHRPSPGAFSLRSNRTWSSRQRKQSVHRNLTCQRY